MAPVGDKSRPSQSQSSSSSIFPPSKTKKNSKKNNNNSLISKKKKKKDEDLRAKALLIHHRQQQLTLLHDRDDDDHHHRHRPILRPKVYITDISNFKKLVQELTGNGAETTTAMEVADHQSSPSSEIFERSSSLPEFKPVVYEYYDQSESDSVTTPSLEASVESSGTPSLGYEEMNSLHQYGYYDQVVPYNLEDTTSDGGSDLPPLDDMLACQADLEALLQDMDQEFPLVFETNYSSESHQILQHHHQQQEADLSIYDYDFSGIVC